MAIIHQNSNHAQKEKATRYLILSIVFLAVPVIYIFAFIQGFYFHSLLHLAPFLIGGIGTFFWNKYRIIKSGIDGKEATASALRELSDDYEVFSGIELGTNTGSARFDHIIVGENGVFIIKVKNQNGTIEGKEDAKSWIQHKVGRKGGQYSNQIGNPVKQVRWQVHILSDYLKEKNMNIWVEGMVFFANPRAQVNVMTERTPVFDSVSELTYYLTSYAPRKMLDDSEMTRVKGLILKEDVDEIDYDFDRLGEGSADIDSSSVFSQGENRRKLDKGSDKSKVISKL